MPSLLLPLVQMSSKCEYAILKENSSDPTEKSSMVSDFNSNFDSNLSQCNAANDVYLQSSISFENRDYYIQNEPLKNEPKNEPLNSQPKEQDPAVIGKQKIIKHPKIFIGTLMILIVMGAGIGMLVSKIQKEGDNLFVYIDRKFGSF